MKNLSIVILLLVLVPLFLRAQYQADEQEKPQGTTAGQVESDSKLRNLVESIVQLARDDGESRPVVLYSRAGFRGNELELHNDWSSYGSDDKWNDKIASIEVPPGMEVWLYEHSGYRGRSLVITGDWCVRQDPWWNNRISSVRLVYSYDDDCGPSRRRDRRDPDHRYRHRRDRGVTFYEHAHFRGATMVIYDDWSRWDSDDFWDNRISSVEVPAGYVAILYKRAGFEGRSKTLRGPISVTLDKDSWNDKVSSIEVYRR